MFALRTLIAFILCVSLAWAADNAKLRTLSGTTVEGDLVSIDDKNITIKGKDGDVVTPLKDILELDIRASALPDKSVNFWDVELMDGSLLHCQDVIFKGKEFQLKLLSGKEAKLPVKAVSYVLRNAQDPEIRKQWKTFVSERGSHDLLVVKLKDEIKRISGTIGDANDQGSEIEFSYEDSKRKMAFNKIHGLSFFHRLDPYANPLCRLYDTTHNILVVKSISTGKDGFVITTPSGLQVECATQLLAKLDFRQGRMKFLSDEEPIEKVLKSNVDGINHYRRNANLDGGAISIGGKKFEKGLSVHAYAELVYDLEGGFNVFKATVGFDDQVGGDSHVKITIIGDGRELHPVIELKRKDKKAPQDVAVDIKNVKQLRIKVESANLLDLGDHVTFAEAKVTK